MTRERRNSMRRVRPGHRCLDRAGGRAGDCRVDLAGVPGDRVHLHRERDQQSRAHRTRPRRGVVVHQFRQRLDRAGHHLGGGDQLHRARDHSALRHRGRSRRGVVVHQLGQRLDRAHHHVGDGDELHGPDVRDPLDIAVGPDGALWFANDGHDSIGRITTSGTVTDYTGTGIHDPVGIAAGPDGALWFTSACESGSKAERMPY